MKTIYSLNEFYDAILAMATQRDTNHVMVIVERQTTTGIIYKCYFHGCKKFYTGKTPDEAISNLRKEEFSVVDKNLVDVEIEHEMEPHQC